MRKRLFSVLSALVLAVLVAAAAAHANPPTIITNHISRDLAPLPAAPAGPCAFAVGRHVEFDIRELFFTDQGGSIVSQAVLTPGATETFTNLSTGTTATLRLPASQHYTYYPDGSFDIATTGLGFVVTSSGGVLALNAGRHVLHLVPVYDDAGNLVTFDVTSVFDAGPEDPLFPAICAALN